jgi:hypothetical protein
MWVPEIRAAGFRELDGNRFASIESKLSQGLAKFARDEAIVARFWSQGRRITRAEVTARAV